MIAGIRAKAAIAAVIVAILFMGYISYYWPISDPYFPMNNGWNGCSQIYQMSSHASLLLSYSDPLPNGTSLIAIVGPRTVFTETESIRLRSFLQAGGTVLLADDFGSGNTLLENLNVSARFSGKPVADLYFYSRAPSFPLISHFTPGPITSNLTAVIMDHPSYIEVSNPESVSVVALTSPFSFIDSSNNGTLAPNEITQSYPVIATIQVGRGKLVMVANSYMFANEMLTLFDNQALFRNILGITTGGAAFDLGHLNRAPLTVERIIFRNEFDTSMALFHTTIVQIATTAVLSAMFSVIYFRRARAERHHVGSALTESHLHTDSA